jgi:hypothetical protein
MAAAAGSNGATTRRPEGGEAAELRGLTRGEGRGGSRGREMQMKQEKAMWQQRSGGRLLQALSAERMKQVLPELDVVPTLLSMLVNAGGGGGDGAQIAVW